MDGVLSPSDIRQRYKVAKSVKHFPMCVICRKLMSDNTDRAFPSCCLHMYCLPCLKIWAKERNQCPMCKVRFTHIVHDLKSSKQCKIDKVPESTSKSNVFGSPFLKNAEAYVSSFEGVYVRWISDDNSSFIGVNSICDDDSDNEDSNQQSTSSNNHQDVSRDDHEPSSSDKQNPASSDSQVPTFSNTQSS